MKNFYFGAVLVVTLIALVAGPLPILLGKTQAVIEASRLRRLGANPNHSNPPGQIDTFSGDGLSPLWFHSVINGQKKAVSGVMAFHATEIRLAPGVLTILQHFDKDFEHEAPPLWNPYGGQRYNNAALIGLAGFQPTPREDVVYSVNMQVSPNFYGTAGMVVEPQGTLRPDGTFKDGIFSMYGICLMGPNSTLHGYKNAVSTLSLNWWPEVVQPLSDELDITAPHKYTIRLRWESETNWAGIIYVDDVEVVRTSLPPFGPLEVQLWGDNYLIENHSDWFAPKVGQENGGTKGVTFGRITVSTEARP